MQHNFGWHHTGGRRSSRSLATGVVGSVGPSQVETTDLVIIVEEPGWVNLELDCASRADNRFLIAGSVAGISGRLGSLL